ncbi:hypothetical protein COOONC_10326, partial [Cooperia oncophora]
LITTCQVKQTFTRCHSHCDYESIPLVENKRSHLPFCCECENAGEEPLLKCSQCVRSFHESCLTLKLSEIYTTPVTSCVNHVYWVRPYVLDSQ